MKTRYNSRLSLMAISAFALIASNTSVRATDYSFGTVSGPFTITATDTARAIGWNLGTLADPDPGAVYWRGSASDTTYAHFDLSTLVGATINGSVNLNFTVNSTYGGDIVNGQLATANGSWSAPGSAPGNTAIGDSALLNGSYSSGQTATWTLSESTFQSLVNSPSSFYGLVVSASSGSSAHFYGLPTLTGTAESYAIKVTGGTDWSPAVWDGGSSTLVIFGSSNVSGGNISISPSSTLSVSDAATLGGGSFSGTIGNYGALSFSGSASQTLSGSITGSGALNKNGSGTLTLSANNTFNGGVTISGGTLTAGNNTLGAGPVTINNGGTLSTSSDWVFGGVTPYGRNGNIVPSVTVNSGGTLRFGDGTGINAMTNLYLNGGLVTGGGGYFPDQFGAICLVDGNEQITAGGATISTIESRIGVYNGNNTITVTDGSTLNITGLVRDGTWWGSNAGGFIKAGNGTLMLSNANTFSGTATVNAGTLQIENTTALPGAATLSVNGGSVNLNYSGNTAIAGLVINGVTQTAGGTYGSSASGATHVNDTYFSGNGTVSIGSVPLRVTYVGNQNTAGTVPVDSNTYSNGNTVTVLGNTGNLTKPGCSFLNWNVAADGSGSTYGVGDTFSISLDTSLYAQWGYTPVTWGPATALTGNADVSTDGTFVYAYTQSNTTATVNGVTFAAGNSSSSLGGGNVTFSGFETVWTYPYDEGHFGGEYGKLIKGGITRWNNNAANAEVTLNNLTPGNQYQVQIWMADYRYGFGSLSQTLDGQVTLQAGEGVGKLSTGSFTASSSSQLIKISGNLQINAIQVRDVTGGSDLASWKTANGVTGGDSDDDDHDGLTNFAEYAFGLNPKSSASVNAITTQLDKTTGAFSYQRRDDALTGLTYTVWYSTDLVNWTEDSTATQPDGTADSSGVETITATLTPALLTNDKLFVQVRAN